MEKKKPVPKKHGGYPIGPRKEVSYFNTILRSRELALDLLDRKYPGWSKELKLDRAEILTSKLWKGNLLLRGMIVRRSKKKLNVK